MVYVFFHLSNQLYSMAIPMGIHSFYTKKYEVKEKNKLTIIFPQK